MSLKLWLKQYYWVALVGLLLVGGYFWQHQKTQSAGLETETEKIALKEATPASMSQTNTTGSEKQVTQKTGNTVVVVDIKGAVNHPGIYHLKSDDRINDAVKKAGGLTAEADENQLNLAQKVQDQDLIYVPIKGETPQTPSATTSGAESTAKINLNTATVTDLQQLDGIGLKKAEKIINYRENQGPFQSAADLSKVNGFGEKTVARLQDQIVV